MSNTGNFQNEQRQHQVFGDDKFTRLDNRTKISLMASIMFGLEETLSEEQAVDHALSIDRLVGDRLRQLKKEKNRLKTQVLETR